MGMCTACKFIISILLIGLNVLGLVVGAVLLGLAAWQWVGYTGNPSLYQQLYGNDIREVLIFFMTGGAFLVVVSVIGILAGVASLFARLRYLAVLLLLLYTAVLFALYTLEVISVTLDFSQYFANKDQVATTIKGAFASLLAQDGGFNTTTARWIELVQSTYGCCGYYNGSVYEGTHTAMWHYWTYPAMYPNATVYRPMSCCGAIPSGTVCHKWQATYYKDGCGPVFLDIYQKISWSVLGISLAVVVIEALVLILPLFLIGLVLAGKCEKKKAEKM